MWPFPTKNMFTDCVYVWDSRFLLRKMADKKMALSGQRHGEGSAGKQHNQEEKQ